MGKDRHPAGRYYCTLNPAENKQSIAHVQSSIARDLCYVIDVKKNGMLHSPLRDTLG